MQNILIIKYIIIVTIDENTKKMHNDYYYFQIPIHRMQQIPELTDLQISLGSHQSISRVGGGGGVGVFVADKLFISTWLGGTLKI